MGGPSGTVTLLFTDIEGSTRLWDMHPAEMSVALVRHDALLRAVIEGSDGFVFKTVGDAFCAAFASASDGIRAALAAQLAIGSEPWPAATPIRVRMGLHSGNCEERDGDYFGSVVNRAARLEALAHGGQTVVSQVTAGLASESLPAGVTLVDLGEHRLKDLGRPERVFQVCGPGLAEEFAPLRSLDNPALVHNLPAQVSTFVGREREVAELRELVDASRLVTATGAGGAGKTRLALQVAADLVDGSGDGVWFVDFAPLADPDLVAGTIGRALGVHDHGRPMLETLLDALADQRCLIILDNCEHVIDAAAKVADAIVGGCPRVHLLATSREPLGLAGEHVFRVPPLALPEADADDIDSLARSEAVCLFVERAAQHKRGFVLDGENARDVGRLCRRLDGMPLALELAAARVRSLSVAELTRRLDQRFHVLTGGSRTALPRQQTLRALIDWSYDLLGPAEQTLLDRLSVFAGGFDLDAAEAVAAGSDIEKCEILDLLTALVDKSLVQADETRDATRYRLLETVREYAAERLGEDIRAETRGAHRDHYLALAETAAPELVASGQVVWLNRLADDHDNLRAACAACLADADPRPGLRLGVALRWYWEVRGHAVEGSDFLGELLGRPHGSGDDLLRARALAARGDLLYGIGDYGASQECADEARGIGRALDNDALVADALRTAGVTALRRGDPTRGLALVEEGVRHARATGAAQLLALLLCAEGHARGAGFGDWRRAHTCFEEALPLLRMSGDRRTLGAVLHNLAGDALETGDLDSAQDFLANMLEVGAELDSSIVLVYAHLSLGTWGVMAEDPRAACGHFTHALHLARRLADRTSVQGALLGMALVATLLADTESAARLHGAADALLDPSGEALDHHDEDLRAADFTRLRELLGDAAFDREYELGRCLSRADADALALEVASRNASDLTR